MELDKNFGHSEKLHPSTFDSATFYSRPITENKNVHEIAQLPPPFSLKLKSPSSFVFKMNRFSNIFILENILGRLENMFIDFQNISGN